MQVEQIPVSELVLLRKARDNKSGTDLEDAFSS